MVSNCCKSTYHVSGSGDFREHDICTNYYVCDKCNKPCDRESTIDEPISEELIEWGMDKMEKPVEGRFEEKHSTGAIVDTDDDDIETDNVQMTYQWLESVDTREWLEHSPSERRDKLYGWIYCDCKSDNDVEFEINQAIEFIEDIEKTAREDERNKFTGVGSERTLRNKVRKLLINFGIEDVATLNEVVRLGMVFLKQMLKKNLRRISQLEAKVEKTKASSYERGKIDQAELSRHTTAYETIVKQAMKAQRAKDLALVEHYLEHGHGGGNWRRLKEQLILELEKE